MDIGHDEYVALVDPDTAFWSLVKKSGLAAMLRITSYNVCYTKLLRWSTILRFTSSGTRSSKQRLPASM